MQYAVVLILAFAPGIFWLWVVYRRDRLRPEPRYLVIRTFLWGILVAFPVSGLESLLIFLVEPEAIDLLQSGSVSFGTAAYISFVVAGITEELGKYLVVKRTVYNSPYFDEPMDGLIYSSASALGFASIENVGYLLTYGWEAILLRGPISTLAHVLFSAMWGYALGLNKVKQAGARTRLWAGLACAMVTHGLFNFLIFTESGYSLLVIPLFLGAGAAFMLMLKRAPRLSPFKGMVGTLLANCPNCGSRVPYSANFCTSCGNSLAKSENDRTTFCSKCGVSLDDQANFCTSCGSRLVK
ncbi:MAG TPA: PrsW family intramembrane metalloprotease [Dehalococcoidia bacterium]|nr:PrsW family intramembrane metalloprotease [Dehalococcoidia bacterium]